MATIKLGDKNVGPGHPPYIIAEIGVNHEGSMDQAKRLIDLAHEGGADAAKFQTYKASTLASKHSPAYWDTTKEPTTSQYKLFQKFDAFGEDEYRALADYCETVGIDFVSTPFDDASIDFLEPMMPFFKIASADILTVPLLRRVARFGKPVVLSTGASTLEEISFALNILRDHGAGPIGLLHCVLNYPTVNANAHLDMIKGLAEAYPDCVIGYSDHTVPDPAMVVATAAYAKGAFVIEKHFTHDKSLPGNDHYHAMDVADLKRLRENCRTLHAASGLSEKAPLSSEEPARQNARRSIVLARSLREGETLDETALTYKRPGSGISPRYWNEVIGRKVRRTLDEDHVLTWDDVDGIPIR